MPATPIRGVEVRPDDDQVTVNRELMRVLNEVLPRLTAAESMLEQLKAQVS